MIKKHIVIGIILASVALTACEDLDPETFRKNLHLPDENFSPNPEQGLSLYNSHCMQCHGSKGSGSRQGPPLVHKTYRPDHHPDIAFHLAVKNGVKQHHWSFGDMQPVKNLTPEDVGHIIAYLRKEQRRLGIK